MHFGSNDKRIFIFHAFIKLLKLLYIADRKSLLRWNEPITSDQYVSMDNGPVLSKTYRIINETYDESHIWKKQISDRFDHKVRLKDPTSTSDLDWLSQSEIEILNEVFGKFGDWDRWKLNNFTHSFPEWQDPEGSMIPFTIRDVLELEGREPEVIDSAFDMIQANTYNRRLEKAS